MSVGGLDMSALGVATPKPKVVSMLYAEGNFYALDDDGHMFKRIRDPRADPNFSGRNPDAGWMWVEIAGPRTP